MVENIRCYNYQVHQIYMISSLQKLYSAAKGHMFAPQNFSGNNFLYRAGRAIFLFRDVSKKIRRSIRRWVKSPILARKRASLFAHMRNSDWVSAKREVRELAALAEKSHDARLMEEIGKICPTLSEYEQSATLRLASRRLRRGEQPKEWRGEHVDGLLLVDFVENENQGMGGTLKRGFLLNGIANHAKACIAIVQPRLQSLFSRTFPHIEILSYDKNIAKQLSNQATKIAGSEHLDFYIGSNAEKIRSCFKPLQVDRDSTSELRNRYLKQNSLPLVGISWGSSAYAKEVPSLEDWGLLLKNTDAHFVSLQYGNIEHDIAELQNRSGKIITLDFSVDQLKDMDRFASQISTLDAVVTISNTGAHLAGALGIPMIVLNDDTFRRAWPVDIDQIPHYPAATIIRMAKRPWRAAIREVEIKLLEILRSNHKFNLRENW